MMNTPLLAANNLLRPKIRILAGGALIGAAAVSFPACGNILKDVASYGFSSTQYGWLFVVQGLLAIGSSLFSSKLHSKLTARQILVAGLLSGAAAMILLAVSLIVPKDHHAQYITVVLANVFMGTAVGLGISVLNVLAATAWGERSAKGIAALHTMLGAGLTLGPFLISAGLALHIWWLAPLLVSALLISIVPRGKDSDLTPDQLTDRDKPLSPLPRMALVFALLAFLYGIAEATFSNWCVIYLHEEAGLPVASAGLALSVFWAAVTLGRFGCTAVSNRQIAGAVMLVSPLVMIVAFVTVSYGRGFAMGLPAFALSGAGCACFYPAILAKATANAGRHRQFVSGLMVATVLGGTGVGTYLTAFWRDTYGISLHDIYRWSAIIPAVILGVTLALVRSDRRS